MNRVTRRQKRTAARERAFAKRHGKSGQVRRWIQKMPPGQRVLIAGVGPFTTPVPSHVLFPEPSR